MKVGLGRRAKVDREPGFVAIDPFDALVQLLTTGDIESRQQLAIRMGSLLTALEGDSPSEPELLVRALEAALEPVSSDRIWLALAVLTGSLPEVERMTRALRHARLDGPLAAVLRILAEDDLLRSEWSPVEVVVGQTLVDVQHTSSTRLNTGIQRVVRETVFRWQRDHAVVLVGWSSGYLGMRRLDPPERQRLRNGNVQPQDLRTSSSATAQVIEGDIDGASNVVLVPWKCTVIIPELAAEPQRAGRYQALAAYSGCRVAMIGYDCVPLTASETTAEGMAGAFARSLAAAAHFDRVAAISDSAAVEYTGWRSMLGGSGRRGPEVRSVELAVEPRQTSREADEVVVDLMKIGQLPLVLAVGSHEPRKNHLAVLQAAELLWREGLEFSLSFVGGNSWKSEIFEAQVRSLQALGRPVQTILALSDELLWAAYRLSYCTVFVSVHEGYGLPVAESLASGTPVVTSDLGSMLELASRGGALIVDPADDDAIARAIGRLLRSHALRQRLADEALQLSWRTWDEYASQCWRFLVDGVDPSPFLPR